MKCNASAMSVAAKVAMKEYLRKPNKQKRLLWIIGGDRSEIIDQMLMLEVSRSGLNLRRVVSG